MCECACQETSARCVHVHVCDYNGGGAGGSGVKINDEAVSGNETWSSQKISAELAAVPALPPGGRAGQILEKIDDMDYHTHWVDKPAIGGGGTSSALLQITKMGVSNGTVNASQPVSTANPHDVVIPLPSADPALLYPPVEVLSFTPGTGSSLTKNRFDNGEQGDFIPNPQVIFDGTMRLKSDYQETINVSIPIGSYNVFSLAIDRSRFSPGTLQISGPQTGVSWNPNDKGSLCSLSNNNLSAAITTPNHAVRATVPRSTGKHYWEVSIQSPGNVYIGITTATTSMSNYLQNGYDSDQQRGWNYNGSLYPGIRAYTSGFSAGDVIGVALDLDAKTLRFFKNGVDQGISHSDLAGLGPVYPVFVCSYYNTAQVTANFGAAPFQYAMPNGYLPYGGSAGKFLFQDGTAIKKWTGSGFATIGAAPASEAQFISDGVDSINGVDINLLTDIQVLFASPSASPVTFSYRGLPRPQLVLPTGLIDLGAIQSIQSVQMAASQSGGGELKYLLTRNGVDWFTIAASGQPFTPVNATAADAEASGIPRSVLEALTPSDWASFFAGAKADRIGFGYFLKQAIFSDQAANDALTLNVVYPGKWFKALHGVDYNYYYHQTGDQLVVELHKSGDWKINYAG